MEVRQLDDQLVTEYKSESQRARIMTERWVASHITCPRCQGTLTALSNNARGADFSCADCKQRFQLKSYRGKSKSKLIGAEYRTTLSTHLSEDAPDLLVLRFQRDLTINEVIHYRKDDIGEHHILPRKPLGPNAKRAGWQGCMLDLSSIPGTLVFPPIQ